MSLSFFISYSSIS